MKKRIALQYFMFFLGLFCIVYYIACVCGYGWSISILYLWLVIGGTLCLKGGWFALKKGNHSKRIKIFSDVFDAVMVTFLFTVFIFFIVIGCEAKQESRPDCAYIFLLGAKVDGETPSDALQSRIDVAYAYLLKNKNTIAVCTGGKGNDEAISEGQCAANTLMKMGISRERLLVENRSATTVENLRFAMDLIGNPSGMHIGIVTSDYHMFRAKIILSGYTNAVIEGIPTKSNSFLLPHYVLREYITFWVDLLLGNIRLK